ncbi:hypothetical protein NA57DRAFT_77397 [Rhizodiscina lignyota]|uniref:WD40 repeat-like protein n=1 Tax=Rhizodiscina lignyota TaxID=1504668 RepID=A0A9P4IEP0_9PEZI|nr:hypothetical protein NA57DRAFT_77397 [Rhizodiscina lignyota]
MAANGRELPGFYFDPEKKKYFKIEANHVAPRGSKYSQEAKRKRSEAFVQTKQQELLQRSRVLQSASIAGVALHRELGCRQPGFLRARSECVVEQLGNQWSVNLEREYAMGLNRPDINCFDIDRITGGFILGVADAKGIGNVIAFPPKDENAENRGAEGASPWVMMAFRSTISSISMSPSNTIVATSTGSHQAPVVYITKATHQPETFRRTGRNLLRMGQYSSPTNPGLSLQFRPDVDTIWASTFNQFNASGPTENVAIGTSNGVIQLYGENDWQFRQAMSTTSDVLALDWLSPNTLAAGLRNATVRLWDSRSNGTSLRLFHGGPVVGVKRAGNESLVAVCGLKSSLCLYDLRMTKAASPINAHTMIPYPKVSNSTTPVIRFAYENEYTYPVGFDVNADLGIIAAGDGAGGLQVFSLRTGRHERGWKQRMQTRRDEDVWNRCVRIVENDEGPPTICAAIGSRIQKFFW